MLRLEIENEDGGNCTLIAGDGKYMSVTVINDYLHRGEGLKTINFQEYRLLIEKEKIPKQSEENNDDNNDDNDNNDNNDDNDDNDDNDNDNSNNNNKGNNDKVDDKMKRGRPTKARFLFQSTLNNNEEHIQKKTHHQFIKAKHSIPVLTSRHIPNHPGLNTTGKKSEIQWQKEADNFGSFFLCLLVPLSLKTGLPADSSDNPYDLNYDGK